MFNYFKIIVFSFILFTFTFINLISSEIDSIENKNNKPRYVGFTVGLGVPELVFMGLSVRLTKDYYLNYSIGGYPKENNKNFGLLEFNYVRHSFELVKYFKAGKNSKYFESGTANISLALFLVESDNNSNLNFAQYLCLRIGKDYYFNKNIALQFSIGIGYGGYDPEENNYIVSPVGKLNLLFWLK